MVFRKSDSIRFQVKDKKIESVSNSITIGFVGIECIDYTIGAIKSIQTSSPDVKIVYVDNGSCPDTIEKIRLEFPGITIIENKVNIVGKAWNLILNAASDFGTDFTLICNNDIIFSRNTIDGLINTFNRLKKEDDTIVMLTGCCVTRIPGQQDSVAPRDSHEPHPDFACMLVQQDEILNKFNGFSEEYIPAYFEDNDFHARIILQGYKALATAMAPYCHICSRTRNSNPDIVTHNDFRLNRNRFYEKFCVKTTDQAESEEKYNEWLKQFPDKIHPNFVEVISWWVNR